MTTYFLQVCAGIAFWWLMYRLFFKGKAAPKTNRFFLLGGLILPFLLPFVPVSTEVVNAAKPILLPAITINPTDIFMADATQSINWILLLYTLGFSAMFLYQLSGIAAFLKLKKHAVKDEQSNVYKFTNNTMPFSFFGTIFLPEQLPTEQESLIVAHEKWHVKLGHSWDVALASLVQAILWFFPLIPIYVREIRTEHEYEVDERMLTSTTFSTYAETLLHVSLMPIGHTQFHSFSSPTLKNRIKMMTKTQNQNTWKLIIFLPLICSMVYLNACNKQAENPPVKPAAMEMTEVDALPQFSDCATTESQEAQKKCFNSGIVNQIVNNLEYPQSAKDADVEGTVFIGFTINADGNISNKEIKRSIEKTAANTTAVVDLETAAMEVFDGFPTLIPAQKNGKSVAMEYVVPIKFALPPEE